MKLLRLIGDMDAILPAHATEDAEGWINSYRLPTGPWHRILGAKEELIGFLTAASDPEHKRG